MKRIVTLILALALLCTPMFSCGGRQGVDLSNATSLADLNGAKIAAQSGTFHLDALEQVSGITVLDYEDFPALLIALNSNAIDGFVAEEPTAYAECLKNSQLAYVPLINNGTGFTATDADTGIAIAFKTGNAMVSSVNEILATISTETREALMRQAVEMSANKETALDEALALISSNTEIGNGVLRIGMECGYDPFNWTQNTDVNGAVPIANNKGFYANGYDVQVAKYVATELGLTLEVYQYDWNALIPAVQSGTIDGIIAGMSPTAEREIEVDFTDCYYNSNLVIIYKKK